MNHNWYAVITAQVLMAKDISSTQKLIIALISNLSTERGYCFAGNAYIGKCLGLGATTVSQNVSDLETKGYLGRVIYRNDSNQVESRILTIIEKPFDLPLNSDTPPSEKLYTPPPKKLKENNKVFNNKYNNKADFFNYSIKNKKEEEGKPGAEISLPFNSEMFKSIWSEWVAYRSEKKLFKYGKNISKILTKLVKDSDAKENIAVEMIENSMANNWTKIYPLN